MDAVALQPVLTGTSIIASGKRAARILVIDDNVSILEVFRKILSPATTSADRYRQLKSSLFGAHDETTTRCPDFQVDLTISGEAGCRLAAQACASGWPYAAAFVDMRMPEQDGMATIEALWKIDPEVQVVICTAYSDHTWGDVAERFGCSDRWLVLKKPFDPIEVLQLATALSVKWRLQREQRLRLDMLEQRDEARLQELQRANRTLWIMTRCHDALVRSASEQALLDSVCARLVEDGDYALAWVGFAQHDDARTIKPAAHAGIDDGYVDFLCLSWADTERGRGPCGYAIREGRPAVARNIDSDPQFVLWRDEALQRGFASAIALPLRIREVVLGNLGIYSHVPDAFDDDEVALLQELADDIAHGIMSLRDAAARAQAERELTYHANYDAITKLPNRNLFRDRLRQAIAYATRDERLVATLVLRLDRFQPIREAFGDDAGNGVLRAIGERLAACLRAGDTVAYLTGDAFAIAIGDLGNADDVTGMACKLMQAVAQPVGVGDQKVFVTATVGISVSSGGAGDVDTLLRNAASATHCAQAEGGNSFRFYAPAMNERTEARLALEADLHRALRAGELVLHYQPKVSLANGELSGAEALLRWQHPSLGMVMPADFIPQAEESGVILPMGQWVIEAVCRQLRSWRDAGIAVAPVAVNVSAKQFRQKNLVDILRQALASHQIDPALIELEITESALMHNIVTAAAMLRELKAVGVKLTLDDFGTGYSSLSYLQHFPVDHVKIDQAFVREVTVNPVNAAICRSVIDLAHALKLRVVGEGAETEGQLTFLHRHRCDHVQGYYFSRPLAAADYEAMLRSRPVFHLPEASAAQDRTLLIVDDELHILSTLKRLFHHEGWKTLTADNARDGLELLAENAVQVVLSDQRMPTMNGTEFLERVRVLYPETIRIILSGYTDLATVVDAINRGTLFKFLIKPWDDDALREHVREAFQYHELRAGASDAVA